MKAARGVLLNHNGTKSHAVEARVRADVGGVSIDLHRDDCKGSTLVRLSPTQARALMRDLQGRADEADRLAYRAAKQQQQQELTIAIDEVVKELDS